MQSLRIGHTDHNFFYNFLIGLFFPSKIIIQSKYLMIELALFYKYFLITSAFNTL